MCGISLKNVYLTSEQTDFWVTVISSPSNPGWVVEWSAFRSSHFPDFMVTNDVVVEASNISGEEVVTVHEQSFDLSHETNASERAMQAKKRSFFIPVLFFTGSSIKEKRGSNFPSFHSDLFRL